MRIFRRVVFCGVVFQVLSVFPVMAQTAREGAEHAARKSPTLWTFLSNPAFITKYIVMLALGFLALILLKGRFSTGKKLFLLGSAVVLFGLMGNIPVAPFKFFSMHPSPMCVTKAMLYGFRIPFIITLGVILFLSLAGPRLFCGYVCPVGAVQELIHMLSRKLNLKKFRFSFIWASRIRIFVFFLFVFLSATTVLHGIYNGQKVALSLYDYFNPFHGLELSVPEGVLAGLLHYGPFVVVIVLALKLYRPFCHYICPIGLLTHWLEHIAVFKIRFNKNACTDCQSCVKESPCTAMPSIMAGCDIRPDCFACYDCIDACSPDALDVGAGEK